MASIFVSIASYKDAELVHTICSLILNSSGTNEVHVRVLSQCDKSDFRDMDQLGFAGHVDLRCKQIDARESQGACWARAEVQKFFEGEDYYLQIDSHTQFAENWDEILIEDHTLALQYGRPAVLTTYLPSYDLVTGMRVTTKRKPTNVSLHTDYGLPQAKPHYIDEYTLPQITYFFSGHFAFSTGDFVTKVPYDPELFFIGEEISMAIRAYSAGYSLCVPRRFVASHLYERVRYDGKERPLVWDDYEDAGREIKSWQRDTMSQVKAQAICRGQWFGKFGIQNIDLYDEYSAALREIFGINLKRVTWKK